MPKQKRQDLPTEPLHDLLAWWKGAGIQGMIIGGLAVALHGRPRATRDVDAVIWLDEARWAEFLKLGRKHHFLSRIPKPLEFARQSRVFLLRHTTSKIDIDLSVGSLAFEREALDRAGFVKVRRRLVPVVSVEDLIIFKAIPHRDRDLVDIAGLLDLYPELDRERIRRWTDEFASFLEIPEIHTKVELLLREHPPLKHTRGSTH